MRQQNKCKHSSNKNMNGLNSLIKRLTHGLNIKYGYTLFKKDKPKAK